MNKDRSTLKPGEKNTKTHWRRHLRRDRPDIHDRVLSGEISAHAGMIEAGFRKRVARPKMTAFDQLRTLILKAKLSDNECTELIALLTR
jgi:hypothetical protein